MKRVLYEDKGKFVKIDEYEGFGIYQRMTPNGFFVSQEWAITNDDVTLIVESYNRVCVEELFDMIDSYKERKRFGVTAIPHNGRYIMHPSGCKC